MKAVILHSIYPPVFDYFQMVKDFAEFLDIRLDQVTAISDCEIALQPKKLPTFFWSSCKSNTRLVVLNWIPEQFDFERMATAVTKGIKVERALSMDFHIDPRFLFLTQFDPEITGESMKRRFLKINCSPNIPY